MDLDIKIYKKLQDFGVVGASYTIINELINMVDKDRAEQLRLNASSLTLKGKDKLNFEKWKKYLYKNSERTWLINDKEYFEYELSTVYKEMMDI